MTSLDMKICNDMSKWVESLTTSGKKELDHELLKKIKRICKTSDEYVQHLYHLVMTQMNKDHAEIRYSSLLIINEIFIRSHVFREMLLSEFQDFLELTAEIDPDIPLPPPKVVARNLKLKTFQFIQSWHSRFGDGYKRLTLGYQYLKKCKKVDFNDIQVQNIVERQRADEIQRKREAVIQEKVNKAKEDMLETSGVISTMLTQLENCFRLLLPHPEQFSTGYDLEKPSTSGFYLNKDMSNMSHSRILGVNDNVDDKLKDSDLTLKVITSRKDETENPVGSKNRFSRMEDVEKNSKTEKDILRHHGYYDRKFNLVVEVNKGEVEENEDTSAIIENLRDLHKQIVSQYLPEVLKWLKVFTTGNNCTDSLKKAIDLKQMIEAAISKFQDLKIKPKEVTSAENIKCCSKVNDDENDDDFEEVEEKEGFEPFIPLHMREEYGLDPLPSSSSSHFQKVENLENRMWNLNSQEEKDSLDPTSRVSTLKALCDKFKDKSHPYNLSTPDISAETKHEEKSCENYRKKKLLEVAPVLPFDVDLYHWEEENLEAPTIVQYDSLHCFWQAHNSEDLNQAHAEEGKAALRRRYIDFSGKFVPVKWSCRALLPSGKLCPRKDRYKCPFHGKIIARDEQGSPVGVDETAVSSMTKPSTSQDAAPDWQDPELLRDIEAATGINLKMPEKRKTKGEGCSNASKGKSKKRKRFPDLTDIETVTNTTRKRLEKKVLSKKAMKKVSSSLDTIDQKRFSDKFGNQWNYAFNL